MRIRKIAVVCLGAALAFVPALRPADETPGFEQTVQPFLAENCYTCHNADLASGGLNLERYKNSSTVLEDREQWQRIARRIRNGEMPPKGRLRPSPAQINTITAWVDSALGSDAPGPSTAVVARRLNRTEYNNTVRDLLGVDLDPAQDFPQDDALYGFDNIANALTVSPLLMEKYLAAAEKLAHTTVYGPDLKPATVRIFQAVPRRFESANPTKIQTPAYFSKDNYDETGIQIPGALHKIYKIPVDGEYNITLFSNGGWPKNSDPHFMDLYVDGVKVASSQVPNEYTAANERIAGAPMRTRLKLTSGEHHLIAALPKVYEGLPANYKGPNPSKAPVQERRFPPLPATATEEQIKAREAQIERQRSFVPTFDPVVVGEMDIEGPFNAVAGPTPEAKEKVFVCATRDAICERRILTALTSRAYRRPARPTEVDSIVQVAADARQRGRNFDQAVTLGIEAILVSPDFLFRVEQPGKTRLSDYELASRLSYFLWSTMPDEELLHEAARDNLRNPQILETQVRRMLADPKSIALARNFAPQWLETRRLESVAPDRDHFPDFDEYLRFSMQRETELFFDNILRLNRPILEFIDADYTFLNERLAQHYGITGVKGTDFRRVDLAGSNRGGILTQASVLTVSSYGNRTSPVLRGKWVLENLLNAPPPPPPPNVPVLNEAAVGTTASLRKQMEQHRANPGCASCHARMDPIGFALENYNAVGEWRTKDGDFEIDPSGTLADGKTFQGAAGLKEILKADPNAFTAALAEKLYIYALGHGVTSADRPIIQEITRRAAADQYRFAGVILGIVNSAPFQGVSP